MTDKKVLLVNAKGAPAADAVLMLDEVLAAESADLEAGSTRQISECLQMKHGSSVATLAEERAKSCEPNDILAVLRTQGKTATSLGKTQKTSRVPEFAQRREFCIPIPFKRFRTNKGKNH
eukprot:2775627-Amphidinium_carterae.2